MSRSLGSIPKHLKADVIRARIRSGSMGLGYWAAVDAIRLRKQVTKVQERIGGEAAVELFIPREEAESLLEKVKHDQGPVPDNWILSR